MRLKLRRIRLGKRKRNKLIFELGVAILVLIAFFASIAVTTIQKEPIITTEDLWNNAQNITVTFYYRNTTSNSATHVDYQLSAIATYYNGALYISVPAAPSGYDAVYFFSLSLSKDLTWKDLIDRGFNRIEYTLFVKNSTSYGTAKATTTIGLSSSSDRVDIITVDDWKTNDNFYKEYGINATTRVIDVDPGVLAITITTKGVQNNPIFFSVWMPSEPPSKYEYIKLQINLYVASKQPVLKALTEPAVLFIGGLWGALLGVVNRVRSYVASVAGGAGVTAILTGLIGDPWVAIFLTIFMTIVVFIVFKPRRWKLW